MVWGDIGYTSLSSHLLFTFVAFRPVALHFILARRNDTFQQDNARLHAADIVQTLLDTENIGYCL